MRTVRILARSGPRPSTMAVAVAAWEQSCTIIVRTEALVQSRCIVKKYQRVSAWHYSYSVWQTPCKVQPTVHCTSTCRDVVVAVVKLTCCIQCLVTAAAVAIDADVTWYTDTNRRPALVHVHWPLVTISWESVTDPHVSSCNDCGLLGFAVTVEHLLA